MNIEFELKKSPKYRTGKFIGILYFIVFFPSVIYSIFWILKPLIKGQKFDKTLGLILLAVIIIGILINLLKSRNKFFIGLKDGFGAIPKFIANVVNFILLSIVYFLGVGPVSVISKLIGKHFLDIKKTGSTWIDRSKEKIKEEDNYRQF